jgi:hypothetical protein
MASGSARVSASSVTTYAELIRRKQMLRAGALRRELRVVPG